MDEAQVIARLRRMATAPEARGLLDDAALIDGFVITHDSIAEGVHYLPGDPPESVGWKLVAANLSDLAAKGAVPRAALLSMSLNGDGAWESGFLDGIEASCAAYQLALIGGDTIAIPAAAPRVLGLTAIGRAGARMPDRAGAADGDSLWLVGTLGDAAAGLAQLHADAAASGELVDAYRRPVPLLAHGQALATHATAMMDVSDGLLLDARRLAQASSCAVEIDLGALPLSDAFMALRGSAEAPRLFAATGGDDYALLAALPASLDPSTLCLPTAARVTKIGRIACGDPEIRLVSNGRPVALPERLGHEHRPSAASPSTLTAQLADRP
jgi:thiamine-monophosphate kinase